MSTARRILDLEKEFRERAHKEAEVERRELREWAALLDRYLGSVRDYSALKGEPFEEITFERPFKRNVFHVVVDGSAPEWDYLARLKNNDQCVAFVHYVPIQKVGYIGEEPIYIGGYGIPIRRGKESLGGETATH